MAALDSEIKGYESVYESIRSEIIKLMKIRTYNLCMNMSKDNLQLYCSELTMIMILVSIKSFF
jgi:hypothetical protein